MKINTFINLIKFYNSYLTRISIVLGYLIIFIFFYISIFSNPFTSKNHNIYVDDQYRVPSRDDILNNIEQAYNVEYLDAYGSYLICDTSFISEGIVSVFDYYSYDSAAEAEDEGEVYDDVPIDSLKNYDVIRKIFEDESNFSIIEVNTKNLPKTLIRKTQLKVTA